MGPARLALKARHPIGARLSQFCRFFCLSCRQGLSAPAWLQKRVPAETHACARIQYMLSSILLGNRLLQYARPLPPLGSSPLCIWGKPERPGSRQQAGQISAAKSVSHVLPGDFDVRVSANLHARSWFSAPLLRSCQRSSSSLSRKLMCQRR